MWKYSVGCFSFTYFVSLNPFFVDYIAMEWSKHNWKEQINSFVAMKLWIFFWKKNFSKINAAAFFWFGLSFFLSLYLFIIAFVSVAQIESYAINHLKIFSTRRNTKSLIFVICGYAHLYVNDKLIGCEQPLQMHFIIQHHTHTNAFSVVRCCRISNFLEAGGKSIGSSLLFSSLIANYLITSN